MFLAAEPPPTSADWQFSLGQTPVRVSVWFWAAALLLGWSACQSLADGNQRQLLAYLVIWMATVFVSILVHEMGHALAYRRFGQASRVVLVHFGGITLPQQWGGRNIRRPAERMAISAAGPLAQLLLAAGVMAVLKAGGYAVPFPIASVGEWLGLFEGRRFASPMVFAWCWFLLQVNIFWPVLNLLPVPPLDGGQIVREGLTALGVADAAGTAAGIGVVTGGLVAGGAFINDLSYMGILFMILAISCFQSLRGWR